MIPPNIVEAAIDRGIHVLGITDHNSAENVKAVRSAARGTDVTVIGGIEVSSAEEVHVLALFDNDAELERFGQLIYQHLHGANDPDAFGYQWVVDEEGGVIDMNPRLLIGATTMAIADVVERVHEFEGVAIAAHVDRQSYSVVSQLGFIPGDLSLDAIELSPFFGTKGFAGSELIAAGGMVHPQVRFSDAHFVEEIARSSTEFVMAEPTVAEIRLALRGEEGRMVVGRS